MRKITLLITLCTVIAFTSEAQRMLGVATSNWGGLTSLDLNPASIADSRARFVLGLPVFNFAIDNNLASVDLSNALKSTSDAGGAAGLFTYSKSKAFNILLPYADVHLGGLMVSWDEKNSVAISARARGINQFNNFDRTLFSSIMDPGSVSNDLAITSSKFNWTAHLWTELKITYAREIYNEGEHYVKGGLTLNRLGGIGFLSLKGNNLNGHYYKAQDSISTTNTDVQFATSLLNNTSTLANGLGDVFGQFFGKKGGNGWGADLGVIYEWRPEETNSKDQSSNKYKVRGSLALTDIGAIKYNALEARVTANGSMSTGDFASHAGNFSDFAAYANSHGFHVDTGKRTTKVHMPTAMVIGVDYYVKEHFYVNGTWITNMTSRTNYGNSDYGQVTITPRWDTRYFCVALPLTYSGMTHSIKAGLGFRAGGLIFGSDDMLAFIGGKAYGMNFYFGGFVPINKKHHKSHDEKPEKAKMSDSIKGIK